MWPSIQFVFSPEATVALGATVRCSFLGSLKGLGVDVDGGARGSGDPVPPAADEGPRREASFFLSASAWHSPAFDLLRCDDEVNGRLGRWGCCRIEIGDERLNGRRLAQVMWQLATRYQRFLPLTSSNLPGLFWRAFELHGRLHDESKPLIAAERQHAVDTWRWTRRLDPSASLALQLAALFHDVERLFSPPDTWAERYASDYLGFKRAHAAIAGNIAADLIARIDGPVSLASTVRTLVSGHEAPYEPKESNGSPLGNDAQTLAEADALSFFSLNSRTFFEIYGPAYAARKVIYTLARLGRRGRRELRRLKLDIQMRTFLDGVS